MLLSVDGLSPIFYQQKRNGRRNTYICMNLCRHHANKYSQHLGTHKDKQSSLCRTAINLADIYLHSMSYRPRRACLTPPTAPGDFGGCQLSGTSSLDLTTAVRNEFMLIMRSVIKSFSRLSWPVNSVMSSTCSFCRFAPVKRTGLPRSWVVRRAAARAFKSSVASLWVFCDESPVRCVASTLTGVVQIVHHQSMHRLHLAVFDIAGSGYSEFGGRSQSFINRARIASLGMAEAEA
jgi:hypothetical protein